MAPGAPGECNNRPHMSRSWLAVSRPGSAARTSRTPSKMGSVGSARSSEGGTTTSAPPPPPLVEEAAAAAVVVVAAGAASPSSRSCTTTTLGNRFYLGGRPARARNQPTAVRGGRARCAGKIVGTCAIRTGLVHGCIGACVLEVQGASCGREALTLRWQRPWNTATKSSGDTADTPPPLPPPPLLAASESSSPPSPDSSSRRRRSAPPMAEALPAATAASDATPAPATVGGEGGGAGGGCRRSYTKGPRVLVTMRPAPELGGETRPRLAA